MFPILRSPRVLCPGVGKRYMVLEGVYPDGKEATIENYTGLKSFCSRHIQDFLNLISHKTANIFAPAEGSTVPLQNL